MGTPFIYKFERIISILIDIIESVGSNLILDSENKL